MLLDAKTIRADDGLSDGSALFLFVDCQDLRGFTWIG